MLELVLVSLLAAGLYALPPSAFISLSLFAIPHGLWRTYDVLRARIKTK